MSALRTTRRLLVPAAFLCCSAIFQLASATDLSDLFSDDDKEGPDKICHACNHYCGDHDHELYSPPSPMIPSPPPPPMAGSDIIVAEASYKVLLRSGYQVGPYAPPNWPYATTVNITGWPVFSECFPTSVDWNKPFGLSTMYPCAGGASTTVDISVDPDFSSLFLRAGKIWGFTHQESNNPATTWFMQYAQNASTGILSPLTAKAVDWSAWKGLWTPCAGTITPWDTHMGAEEYEPNARDWEEITVLGSPMDGPEDPTSLKARNPFLYRASVRMVRYWGLYEPTVTLAQARAVFNPYAYGFPFEQFPSGAGDGNYANRKWYTLGRVAHELAFVMPDNKTVYTTDDGSNTGFYMFKADSPGPDGLASGVLHCLKVNQTSADGAPMGGGTASWVKMAHGTQDAVKAYIDSRIKYSDIFQYVKPTNGTCPPGFKSINAGHDAGDHQCLILKSGMEVAATYLETRRYCAYMGGTTEFTKWEGLTYDDSRKRIYTSITSVDKGMTNFTIGGKYADTYDIGGYNDLRFQENVCGCVFALDVDPVTYTAYNIYQWKCGNTMAGVNADNQCDLQGLSNPDNIYYEKNMDVLFIGEDTSFHQNDVMWAIDPVTKMMSRIATTPYGAEATSIWFYEDINGWSYLMMDSQHPYGESDQDKVNTPSATGLAGWVGYLGPWKTATWKGRAWIWPSIPVPETEEAKNTVNSINQVYWEDKALLNRVDYSTGKAPYPFVENDR